MNLDLSEEETAAITRKLANLMGNDRHQMSERFRRPKAILAKLRPELTVSPCRRRKCTRREKQRPPRDDADGQRSKLLKPFPITLGANVSMP
jgi:hypothetical protein